MHVAYYAAPFAERAMAFRHTAIATPLLMRFFAASSLRRHYAAAAVALADIYHATISLLFHYRCTLISACRCHVIDAAAATLMLIRLFADADDTSIRHATRDMLPHAACRTPCRRHDFGYYFTMPLLLLIFAAAAIMLSDATRRYAADFDSRCCYAASLIAAFSLFFAAADDDDADACRHCYATILMRLIFATRYYRSRFELPIFSISCAD